MPRGVWVMDPHSGGNKIPEAIKRDTVARVERHAAARYAGLYTRLDIRFRGTLCYFDAYLEPDEPSEALLKITRETAEQFVERMRASPLHLCRLRYFGDEEAWILALCEEHARVRRTAENWSAWMKEHALFPPEEQ